MKLWQIQYHLSMSLERELLYTVYCEYPLKYHVFLILYFTCKYNCMGASERILFFWLWHDSKIKPFPQTYSLCIILKVYICILLSWSNFNGDRISFLFLISLGFLFCFVFIHGGLCNPKLQNTIWDLTHQII